MITTDSEFIPRVILVRPKLWIEVETGRTAPSGDELITQEEVEKAPAPVERFEAHHFHATFGIGEVPSAVVGIPLGFSVNPKIKKQVGEHVDDLDAAEDKDSTPFDKLIKRLNSTVPYIPAKVYMEMEKDPTVTDLEILGIDDYWPEGPQVIFDGYIYKIEMVSDASAAEGSSFQLSLVHWLVDLSATSAVSTLSAVKNPLMLNQRLFVNKMRSSMTQDNTNTGTTSTDTSGPLYTFACQFDVISSAAQAVYDVTTDDLWGGLLYPLLMEIANKSGEEERLYVKCVEGSELGLKAENWGMKALKRFEGNDEVSGTKITTKSYVPSVMADLDPKIAAAVSDSIAQFLGRTSIDAIAGGTLWDLLMQYAGMFGLGIIPRINSVLVVPLFTGCREPYDIELDALASARKATMLNRDVRAVCVAPAAEYSHMTGEAVNVDSVRRLCVGCFSPSEELKDGVILYRTAPSWLVNIPAMSLNTYKTVWNANSINPNHNKYDPDSKDPNQLTPIEAVDKSRSLFDNLAHEIYLNTVLAGRTVEARSRLRFDVGPGSTVRFSNDSVLSGPGGSLDRTYFIGIIAKMTVALDARAASAHTDLWIDHVRPEELNKTDAYSSDTHPIYVGSAFKGAPLDEVFIRPEKPEPFE